MTRLAFLLTLVACSWDLNRMNDQPRCEPGDSRPWLPDRRCDQGPPIGTVAWRVPAETARPPATRATIMRGHDRLARICAPCHGPLGDGNSAIARDMLLRPPPSLLVPPVSAHTDQHIFDVITGGYGLMPAYAYQLSPADRWAVVQFVRVLARSQAFPLADVPPEEDRRWLQ